MIFDKTHVIVKQKFKNNDELFKFIAKDSVKKGIAKTQKVVVDAFKKRESEGTTGFEDGFAIPHARVEGVTKPSVYVIQNNNDFEEWSALDGNGVRYAIALLIPANAGSLHMDVLSGIATKLIDEKFRNMIKSGDGKTIFKAFDVFLKDIIKSFEQPVKAKNTNTGNSKLVVGISACPAGIAHTFMAKQKMEDGAAELGLDVKWETQGANGQKNIISAAEIKKAEVVIIASDIELDLERFKGKKIIVTDTNDAIKNGAKLITRALENGKEFSGVVEHEKINPFKKFMKLFKKSFQSSFGTPWVYLSITGTIVALLSLIGFSMYGRDWTLNGLTLNKELFQLQEIALIALYMSMPFMAGTIAKKATDKGEAFAITFIATMLLNFPMMYAGFNSMNGGVTQTGSFALFYDWNGVFGTVTEGSNILGAVVTTFLTIFVVNSIYKVRKYIDSKNIKAISNGLSPWFTVTLSAIIIFTIVIFLMGGPLSYASSKIVWAFVTYGDGHWWVRFLVGGGFVTLICWDLGGYVNKLTLITLIGLAQYDLRFAALISIGIPIASIGYGATYSIFKKKFKKEDVADASVSFRKGLNGMSEGALNPSNKYGWRVKVPNLLSGFIAGGIAMVLGLYIFKGGHIGVLYAGAQAHLAVANDITWLAKLLPADLGVGTFFISIAYGIIGYYLTMFIGCMAYAGISSITFNLPGKNKVFTNLKNEVK